MKASVPQWQKTIGIDESFHFDIPLGVVKLRSCHADLAEAIAQSAAATSLRHAGCW
jgi:hypothetical protein